MVTSFGATLQLAAAMALQADGRIVVGGDVALQNVKFLLARYLSA